MKDEGGRMKMKLFDLEPFKAQRLNSMPFILPPSYLLFYPTLFSGNMLQA
jgi:hypothetical protein